MERMSNRERIVHAAEEAQVTEVEGPSGRARRRSMTSARMKLVWEVCNGAGKTLKTYPYPDKAAAEAQTKALTSSTRRAHMLRAAKVPMD